ncbi:preprotein translocase subunit YajC [Paenarthrobacter sp. DKR-5]|uniref:preprotein translocase subunit YajC n=1 Tax=Paenarthrobacter sp. DKR-5 TaxID=2835535 RepID=UPI001BDD9B4C|nr:preprotein translocase subunit YajC [Paenarthrobacter sp. DKR-5]MBT1003705.1 preprotein translocase subunit YajC [Paenarthrobacter sp. DKR-5]
MTLALLAIFAVFIFMTFRRQKKAQRQQQEQQAQMGPGVEVMTSFGLYGTVVSVDDAENKVVLELSPGNTATVHRQAVTKILTPAADAAAPAGATTVDPTAPVVPDDASSLTGATSTEDTLPGQPAEPARPETPEETLRRLDQNENKDK